MSWPRTVEVARTHSKKALMTFIITRGRNLSPASKKTAAFSRAGAPARGAHHFLCRYKLLADLTTPIRRYSNIYFQLIIIRDLFGTTNELIPLWHCSCFR